MDEFMKAKDSLKKLVKELGKTKPFYEAMAPRVDGVRKVYTSRVIIEGLVDITGEGFSRRLAEYCAALNAIHEITKTSVKSKEEQLLAQELKNGINIKLVNNVSNSDISGKQFVDNEDNCNKSQEIDVNYDNINDISIRDEEKERAEENKSLFNGHKQTLEVSNDITAITHHKTDENEDNYDNNLINTDISIGDKEEEEVEDNKSLVEEHIREVCHNTSGISQPKTDDNEENNYEKCGQQSNKSEEHFEDEIHDKYVNNSNDNIIFIRDEEEVENDKSLFKGQIQEMSESTSDTSHHKTDDSEEDNKIWDQNSNASEDYSEVKIPENYANNSSDNNISNRDEEEEEVEDHKSLVNGQIREISDNISVISQHKSDDSEEDNKIWDQNSNASEIHFEVKIPENDVNNRNDNNISNSDEEEEVEENKSLVDEQIQGIPDNISVISQPKTDDSGENNYEKCGQQSNKSEEHFEDKIPDNYCHNSNDNNIRDEEKEGVEDHNNSVNGDQQNQEMSANISNKTDDIEEDNYEELNNIKSDSYDNNNNSIEVHINGKQTEDNHKYCEDIVRTVSLPILSRVVVTQIKSFETKKGEIIYNPIGSLQEYCAKRNLPTPKYTEMQKNGLDHLPIFTCKCILSLEDQDIIGIGQGSNKRQAKSEAAVTIVKQLLGRSI